MGCCMGNGPAIGKKNNLVRVTLTNPDINSGVTKVIGAATGLNYGWRANNSELCISPLDYAAAPTEFTLVPDGNCNPI